MYKNRKVLVAGGTGMIGIPLVEMLIEQGAQVRIVSMDSPARAHPKAEFMQLNMLDFGNCMEACRDMEFVFNLLGVKGSPAVTTTRPASFFVPTITFSFNLMEAARQCHVERFLLTSSVAVYAPAKILREEDVWKTFPSPNDRFPSWAKRMCELQAEAFKIEYGWDKIAVVRPPNVYGPFDNFSGENAMVVPSLIKRALEGEDPLRVWGDGSARRDFIHAKDVARGMLVTMEHIPDQPINLGSGVGRSIKELVDIIISNLDRKPEVVWDATKPRGDEMRIMDITKAEKIGFQPEIRLEEGVRDVMNWYRENRNRVNERYDVFAHV